MSKKSFFMAIDVTKRYVVHVEADDMSEAMDKVLILEENEMGDSVDYEVKIDNIMEGLS